MALTSDPLERYAPLPAVTPAPGLAPVRRTNGWAVASLVLGLTAWLAFPFLGALGAVLTGLRARREIRRTGEQGKDLATAGLVLGFLQLGLIALALVVAVLVVVLILVGLLHGL